MIYQRSFQNLLLIFHFHKHCPLWPLQRFFFSATAILWSCSSTSGASLHPPAHRQSGDHLHLKVHLHLYASTSTSECISASTSNQMGSNDLPSPLEVCLGYSWFVFGMWDSGRQVRPPEKRCRPGEGWLRRLASEGPWLEEKNPHDGLSTYTGLSPDVLLRLSIELFVIKLLHTELLREILDMVKRVWHGTPCMVLVWMAWWRDMDGLFTYVCHSALATSLPARTKAVC